MIEIVHLLGLIGVTLIVTRGSIFSRVRQFAKFLECPQCVGWHAGFWTTVLSFPYTGDAAPWTIIGERFWHAILVGGVVSLGSSLSETIMAALDEVTMRLSSGKPIVPPEAP